MNKSITHILIREVQVLGAGIVVSATISLALQHLGKDLELIHGIVVPILFCLGRAAFVTSQPHNISALRRVISQIMLAFALIVLLLFEMGIGLFATANDIPIEVWCIIIGFGILYLFLMCCAESLRQQTMPTIIDMDNSNSGELI
jgi:hypothetical protein